MTVSVLLMILGTIGAQTVCDNRCLDFDGANDYIQSNSPLSGNAPMTIEMWFITEAATGGICTNNNLADFKWLFSWDDNNFGLGDCNGNLGVIYDPACSLGNPLCSGLDDYPISDGEWHHVALAKGNGSIRILVDGVHFTNFGEDSYDLSGTFRIGSSGTGTIGKTWDGKIDDIRIWDHVRSDAEITGNYLCELSGTEPGLITYYDLNQGIPEGNNLNENMAIDLTNTANDGDLSGFTLNSPFSNWICSDNGVEEDCLTVDCNVEPSGSIGWASVFCGLTVELPIQVSGFDFPPLITFDYGDGTTGNIPSHTYSESGDYEVCVTASQDDIPCTAEYCQQVSVEAGLPLQFDNCPPDTNLIVTNFSDCANDVYLPQLTASECGILDNLIEINYMRTDGNDINAPWPEGSTGITAVATNTLTGSTVECEWKATVISSDSCRSSMLCDQAAVSCYSGGASDGVVAAVKDLSQVFGQPLGVDISTAVSTTASWTKEEMGEVFGIAYDKEGNLYFTATSVYGNANNNFGPLGPGGIYKVDGFSLGIDQSWNVSLPNAPGEATSLQNSGCGTPIAIEGVEPGLGNICYDEKNDQLLTTNFEDGKIYIVEPSSGTILQTYDPMLDGTPDDGNPGFAPLGKRIWGIAAFVNESEEVEVYYAVWATDMRNKDTGSSGVHNTIRRVNLDAAGLIDASTDEEVIVLPYLDHAISGGNCEYPDPQLSCPVADIAFSEDGEVMLLAERSMHGDLRANPDNIAYRWAHNSRVLEYIREDGDWMYSRQIEIGSIPSDADLTTANNSAGGVTFGNGFSIKEEGSCDSTVWVTGDFLHQLDTSSLIYGMQGFALEDESISNSSSYLIDFDGSNSYNKTFIGDVEAIDCGGCREPSDCGALIEDTLAFACSKPGLSYQYTFAFENNTEFEVTSVVLYAATPEGVTLSSPYFNFYQNPIAPGATSQTVEMEIQLTEVPVEPLEICFQVIYLTDNYECCHYEHCVTIEPIDPCRLVSVEPMESEEQCCYELGLVNDYCDNYFTAIQTEILTPGVTFTDYDGEGWDTSINAEETVINWRQEGNIPIGPLNDLSFCLDSIFSMDQIPQQIAVHWLSAGPGGEGFIVCSDTLEFFCEPCLLLDGDTECVEEEHSYNYTIANNAGQASTLIVFECQTPNVAFEPAAIEVDLEDGESYDGTVNISSLDGSPLPGNMEIEFKAILFDSTGWCCHLDGFSMFLEDCTGSPGVCSCGEYDTFQSLVNQGFLFDHSCVISQMSLNPVGSFDSCDKIIWQMQGPGMDQPIFTETFGNNSAYYEFSLPGNYLIRMQAERRDESNQVCYDGLTAAFEQSVNIDCPPDEEYVTRRVKSVRAFPIPATRTLAYTIPEEGQYTVSIFDMRGDHKAGFRRNVQSDIPEVLNISAYPPGAYCLMVHNERTGKVDRIRFVKSR